MKTLNLFGKLFLVASIAILSACSDNGNDDPDYDTPDDNDGGNEIQHM